MTQKHIEGDVVMYDNKIMVVKEPRDGSHFDLSCPKEGLVYCFVGVDEIKPVILTPEILEKNGWKRTQIFIDDDGFEFHTYIDDERCLDLQYYPQYKKFAAFICKQEVLSDIEYVHQLQHLLFGLGLPMDLKV